MINSKTAGISVMLLLIAVSMYPGIADAGSTGRGGLVTGTDFVIFYNYTGYWQGYYSVITSNTSPVLNSSYNYSNASYNYNFSETGIGINTIRSLELGTSSIREGDYLLITTSPLPPVLTGLRAGNLSYIDAITGQNDESGTNTFTLTSSYRIPYTGGTVLTGVPTLYTYVDSNPQFNYFKEGLLEDANGTIVFAAPINSAPVRGYDGTSYYFQFILPNNGSNPLTYYMFYLPSDLPLESEEEESGENTGGSGGGGGGGAGAASGEPYSNIEKQEIREEYLQANLTASYKFRTPELVIYEVLITPAKSLGPVSVKIEELRGLSKMKGVTQPFGIIYVHTNIWVSAKELADRKGMMDARVRFRIENRWMAETNLYDSKIRLLRWNQSRWVPLETEPRGRDANYTYFEAKTDGFSHFAISIDPFYQAVPIYPMTTPGINATSALMETPSGTAGETKLPLAALTAAILAGIFLYRLIAERLK